ncbi:CLUMA_CG014920, isoform A [Clunio marinus]|uniref:CLUMA_CG014920, isoform A n=1 Tax=Clunio marinus TaxID=568069 RepID=A0A1J1INH4_9DIPT|nr:CLUMA_CG014920, isoform A [Clunio marinus]
MSIETATSAFLLFSSCSSENSEVNRKKLINLIIDHFLTFNTININFNHYTNLGLDYTNS